MPWNADRTWVTGEEFPFSASHVKKAGDRIRRAHDRDEPCVDDDLELLDLFRASHWPALRHVHDRLRRLFHKRRRLDPQIIPITARPLKTREAIMAKLVRDRTRLNRIQDIAGARIVVPDRRVQDLALDIISNSLSALQPYLAKDTRDAADEHGYRAIHVVVTTAHPGLGERTAEIQIRTELQNLWAQLVEGLDAILGSDLKHGNGPADFQEYLLARSAQVRAFEWGEPFTMEIEMPPFPKST